MMKNNEHTLDEQIRAALAEHEATYNADHWQKMAQQLDALDASEADFDASLRGRLADVSRVPQMGDWSKMAAMLDNLNDEVVDNETAFDNSLRDKLENINRRFQPNHWEMMNDRLDRELTWRGKVVRYKVVEVAMMLLLLFTVANTLDFVARTDNAEWLMLNGELKNESKVAPSALPNETNSIQQNATTPQTQAKKATQPAQNDPSAWRLRRGLPSKVQQPATQPNSDNKGSQPVVFENVDLKIQPLMPQNAVQNAVQNEAIATTNTALQNSATTTATGQKSDATNTTVAAIETELGTPKSKFETIDVLPLGATNLLKNNDLAAIPPTPKWGGEKKAGWSLSGVVSWATDWVKTPYVKDRELHVAKQTVHNAGVAARIAYRYHGLEVESGIAYNTKSYDLPAKLTTGSLATGFRSIDNDNLKLSIVSIPLSINTTLVKKKRWEITTRLGSAWNMIASSKTIRQGLEIDNTTTGAQPTTNSDNEVNSYKAGLFQKGGTRANNTFLTASAGLGVEYRLTPRSSVFVQPQFELMTSRKGIGTLSETTTGGDTYRTFNVQAGTKLRF
jgi:hypothetical protein